MEHMDLHQPTVRNEEQKELKLHARDGEDDTSYSSEKRGKHDSDLPEEKAVIEDHQWTDLFNFQRYTSEPTQVYENLIIVCKKEIEAGKKAFTEASKFFETKFGDLEEKRPCRQTSYVIETIRYVQQQVKIGLEMADQILPSFTKDVENYVKYRDGPLSVLQVTEKKYFKKIEELAEIPNVGKMMKELLYNEKDDEKIKHRSGLTQRDVYGIIHYLWKNKDIFIPYRKENTINEEQDGESEVEDLFIQHKDTMEELSSIRYNYETAKDDVKKHVENYEHEVLHRRLTLDGFLTAVDHWVRIMRRQLQLLLQKDVIANGCDANFDDDWEMVLRGG